MRARLNESLLYESLRSLVGDGAWSLLTTLAGSVDISRPLPEIVRPVAEAAVYNVYRKKLLNRTTLFISHRLGSVRMADEIIVLKNGRIMAVAPHEELMASCDYYAGLYNTQKEMYDEKK